MFFPWIWLNKIQSNTFQINRWTRKKISLHRLKNLIIWWESSMIPMRATRIEISRIWLLSPVRFMRSLRKRSNRKRVTSSRKGIPRMSWMFDIEVFLWISWKISKLNAFCFCSAWGTWIQSGLRPSLAIPLHTGSWWRDPPLLMSGKRSLFCFSSPFLNCFHQK